MDIEALVRAVAAEVARQLQTPRVRVLILGGRDEVVAAETARRLGGEILFRGEAEGPFDHYVLPRLTCSDMADLAAGRAAGEIMAEALGLLLRGVPVQVLAFEWREHAATAPEALLRLYEGYERQLAAYGLTLLETERPQTLRTRATVVTEAVVREASEAGARTLQVPARAIVTPLAAETARTLNVTISTF